MTRRSRRQFSDEPYKLRNERRAFLAANAATLIVWKGMKQRCNNPNNPAFKWYGARGTPQLLRQVVQGQIWREP